MSFHFKQFTIQDDRCSHKVGTDGTLLGVWANMNKARFILDVGTGCGLIALIAAQRTSGQTTIEAVELSLSDFEQAKENIKGSQWANRIKIHHTAIQQFKTDLLFDCILSNPPYFTNSYKPANKNREATRHTVMLSFSELIFHAQRLLAPTGRLSVILPYQEGLQFITLAHTHSFYTTRQWSFKTRATKPIERWLLEFSLYKPSAIETGEIVLYKNRDEWSDEYKRLTNDFYLDR